MTITQTVKAVAARVGGATTNAFGGVDFVDDHRIVRFAVEDVDANEVEVIVLGPAPARICEGSARLSGVFATVDGIIATVAALSDAAKASKVCAYCGADEDKASGLCPAHADREHGPFVVERYENSGDLVAVGFLVPADRGEPLVDFVTHGDFGVVDSVVHPDPDVIFPSEES